MKALKTIVATAVIVFALTTVAMAGARQVDSRDDAASPTTGPAARLHAPQATLEMSHNRARDHREPTAGAAANHAQAPQHAQARDSSAGTHGGGTHHDDDTHGGGTHHDGGTHHGGGTHHDGDTHGGGTHHS